MKLRALTFTAVLTALFITALAPASAEAKIWQRDGGCSNNVCVNYIYHGGADAQRSTASACNMRGWNHGSASRIRYRYATGDIAPYVTYKLITRCRYADGWEVTHKHYNGVSTYTSPRGDSQTIRHW